MVFDGFTRERGGRMAIRGSVSDDGLDFLLLCSM
jgi:hypothetical protein